MEIFCPFVVVKLMEGESSEIVGKMYLGYAGHKALPVQEGISRH